MPKEKENQNEPVGKILTSAGGFVLMIRFETRESAVEYANRHNIEAIDVHYNG